MKSFMFLFTPFEVSRQLSDSCMITVMQVRFFTYDREKDYHFILFQLIRSAGGGIGVTLMNVDLDFTYYKYCIKKWWQKVTNIDKWMDWL